MTIPSTLQDIRTKFRRMTAAQSPEQISDGEIDKYINTFYIQDFPEHNRMESLKTNLAFYTQANIDSYRLGNTVSGPIICPYTQDQILSIEPPMYVSGYQVYFTQSPEQFWRLNPEITTMEQDAFGDGVSLTYTGQTSAFPMLRGYSDNGDVLTPRVMVTSQSVAGATMNLVDNGLGVFINPITKAVIAGTSINYLTGAFTVTFPAAVAANAPITIEYVPIQTSRPVMALFSQGIFFLRPTPDQGYYVEIQAYRTPTIALNDLNPLLPMMDRPELAEWWQTIACGAALKFFEDNGDFDSYGKYMQIMTQYRRLAARRNIAQISRERAPSIYSSGEGANMGAQFPYYQY